MDNEHETNGEIGAQKAQSNSIVARSVTNLQELPPPASLQAAVSKTNNFTQESMDMAFFVLSGVGAIVVIVVLISLSKQNPTTGRGIVGTATAGFREGVTSAWFHYFDNPIQADTNILLKIITGDNPWFKLELSSEPLLKNSSISNVSFGFVVDFHSRQSYYEYCGENGLNLNDLKQFCQKAAPLHNYKDPTATAIFDDFKANKTYELWLQFNETPGSAENTSLLTLSLFINGMPQPMFLERSMLPLRKVVQMQLSGTVSIAWKVLRVF